MWQQTLITLRARPQGSHLVTQELLDGLPELRACRVGLLHFWLQHTSASLIVNENADPAVCRDFEVFFNPLVPQGELGYEHNDEGTDDWPAHFKASLLGCQLTLPATAGWLALVACTVSSLAQVRMPEVHDQGAVRSHSSAMARNSNAGQGRVAPKLTHRTGHTGH
ncbi:YjbQ family protein [Pseudomonas agarici]|nr:YjbQ family protein [Pseudomonas agarici]